MDTPAELVVNVEGLAVVLRRMDGERGWMGRDLPTLAAEPRILPELLVLSTGEGLTETEKGGLRMVLTQLHGLESCARPLLISLVREWEPVIPEDQLLFELEWVEVEDRHHIFPFIELHYSLSTEAAPYLDVYGDWVTKFLGTRPRGVERRSR